MKKDLKSIADFLFEIGILSKTPRSGFHFLGSGEQSVAEHVHRTLYAAFVLSSMEKDVDTEKVLKMALFHDLAEARTSDLNYVHQKYAETNEQKAIEDLAGTVDFGEDILEILEEYRERKSKESLLAKDADQLEWILSLKEQVDIGNSRADSWIPSAVKRLKTKVAKDLANKIVKTNSDDWWFSDKKSSWWINRDKKA